MQPRSTRHAYDAIAGQWHHHRRAFSSRPFVDALVAALRPGAPLLDVGCGTGAPIARYLTDRGFHITGIDRWEVDDRSSRGHIAVLATRT